MQDKLWDINMLLEHYPALKLWGVRSMIRYRTIPIVRLGRRIYFDPEEIDKWISDHKIEAKKNISR